MMKQFQDLRKFIDYLESKGELIRITYPVAAKLEITEISRRLLKDGGPAILFENVIKDNGERSDYPVLTNLYASIHRISLGLGLNGQNELKELGELFAFLRQPTPPASFKEILSLMPTAKRVLSMASKTVSKAVCQEIVYTNPDLTDFPIQTCWPHDISPLITWPLIITKGPTNAKIDNYNIGIYRLQLISKNKLLMRWLKMRGGEQQYRRAGEQNLKTFPAAAVIGACPAVTLAGVMPLPDNVSEYNFAGLIKNKNIELVQCKTIDLKVPANAEIILEGEVSYEEYLPEGPFGDHTGYYNEVENFPVFNIKAITTRKNAIYLSTYTGKPPDEPSILGEALNEVFIPLLKQQFPEIIDFWLPPEGCSYRIANVSIKKSYPGQAKKIMMGVWSFLRQFMYTKYIIVLDSDINIRDWKEVIWAISTRTDPKRDSVFIENSPIDYLDFASPVASLGSKMGIDATNKIFPETTRSWGEKIDMNKEIVDKINLIWDKLF